TTNNVAEYRALLLGLRGARELGASEGEVGGDSELIAKRVRGLYKVRKEDLRPLHEDARALARQFERFSIRTVPRAQNARADALVNAALDGGAPPPPPVPGARAKRPQPRAAGADAGGAAGDRGLHRDLHPGRKKRAAVLDERDAEPRVERVADLRADLPRADAGCALRDPLGAPTRGPVPVPRRGGGGGRGGSVGGRV